MSAAAPHPNREEPRFSRMRLLGRGAVLAGVAVAELGPTKLLSIARADGGRVALEDFGAVGNGAADDSAALRRAIAAAGPGGTVTSAGGRTFLVSSSVMLDSQCTLDLAGSTIKKAGSLHGPALVVNGAGVILRHLNVDGARRDGARGPGIDWRGSAGELTDVSVSRCQEDGVVLTTNKEAAITGSRCSSTDNGRSGFSVPTGVAKLYACVADRNEECGFFFGVSSLAGSHVDGTARRNRIGVQIRSRGGTSRRIVVNDNIRYGLLMDYDGPSALPGEWTFDYVECSRNGVGRDKTGTGLELIGSDRNRFQRVLAKANPGYGIAIAGGSSYNWFGRVLCNQKGAGDGDPGIHISGGASYNQIDRAVVRNHTFGVIIGEGLSPKNNDFNFVQHLTVVGCSWGVLRLDSGSSNRFGRVVSRRNATIDRALTGGLIDFRSEDTFRNAIDFLDHHNRHTRIRAPRFLVHADAQSYENVVRKGTPLALLRRLTRDANGKNHFFR